MGQHKRNPTAIAAKEGKLDPKKPPMGAKQSERLMRRAITRMLYEGILPRGFGGWRGK